MNLWPLCNAAGLGFGTERVAWSKEKSTELLCYSASGEMEEWKIGV